MCMIRATNRSLSRRSTQDHRPFEGHPIYCGAPLRVFSPFTDTEESLTEVLLESVPEHSDEQPVAHEQTVISFHTHSEGHDRI